MESWLPLIDAVLIGISGVCALTGYVFIRLRKIAYHRACMITATVFAALFLILYLIRWALIPTKFFTGAGLAKGVYLTVLTSHIILAAIIGPLVLVTLYHALRRQFPRHKHIARVTLPIWLYVVLSGWVVYLMLYQIQWTSTARAVFIR